jgi:hypothetical protein
MCENIHIIMIYPVGWSARVCRGLLFLYVAAACVASSFPKLSLADLVSQSEAIISGTVVRSWTGWDSEHRFIWTHTEIHVSGLLKGRSQSVITVSEPGGTADGMTMQIPGATAFTPGEHIHLFLYKTPLGYMRTTGYGQGKLLVSPDGHVHTNKSAEGLDNLDGLSSAEFRARVARLAVK